MMAQCKEKLNIAMFGQKRIPSREGGVEIVVEELCTRMVPKNDVENPIWIYWNKGIEQAPIIVQKCYESVCKYSNQKIILLNDRNLADYIRLPDYIEKKKDAGQIPMAGYADLMRFTLLEHYGGTWIDSTVYLTDLIPDMILNSDFFAVRNSLLLIDNPMQYPAWFLHAKKGNKTIREIRNVAFAYWLKNEHVIEYLPPNLIITLVVKSNPEVEKAIPYMNSDYSEYLVKVLADDYSEEKNQYVVIASQVHLSSGIILLGMVNEDKLMWELQKSLSIIFLSKSSMQKKIIMRI